MTKPTREQAEQAVKTLIAWAGDDPSRKELLETPRRVVSSYEEFFSGYKADLKSSKLNKTFDSKGYNEMVIVKNIFLQSFCEHHMLPIIGNAFIAYIPDEKIIGLSKIARIVDIFSRRLQIQERLVIEIAEFIDNILKPKGVGVIIESSHQCLSLRGAFKQNSLMRTLHLTGCFKEKEFKEEFLKNYSV